MNDFLRCCLQKNPKDRATAEQLLTHPWLNGVLEEDLVLEKYVEKALYRIKNGVVNEEEEEEDEEEEMVRLLNNTFTVYILTIIL